MPVRKLLIANRGEIACRVIRTCRKLGIATVAVHSDADADAMHVRMADEAVRIGPAPVAESYLRADAILEAARATGADAIHPGYGFLSENPAFVEAVEAAGLTFVGPPASAIRAMGLKDKAKALMEEAGVPVVPGHHGEMQDAVYLSGKASEIGYPVLIKARAGGGGKGMRLVERDGDFAEALESARREAQASFGDPACLVEKYVQSPRHIEVQVFGDMHGNVVHLFERDCSLQRRHQKVIEEAPAPGMTPELRQRMGDAAVAAAKAVGYVGAGTVEFIVDGALFPDPDAFWFMEMNTRLQVEHPVTEAVTGLDLVALQIAVAEGQALPFTQDDLRLTGHAIEARLYAEDASAGFLPATGRLDVLRFGGGVRVDTGVEEGDEVTPFYDPMIAKLISHGPDRASALRSLVRALDETLVAGSVTNRGFLSRLLSDEDVAAGRVDTGLIARKGEALTAEPEAEAVDLALGALAVLTSGDMAFRDFRLFGPARQVVAFEDGLVTVETEGVRRSVETPLGAVALKRASRDGDKLAFVEDGVSGAGRVVMTRSGVLLQRGVRQHHLAFATGKAGAGAATADRVLAPMPGLVTQVRAEAGQEVAEGDTLVILEAMKMEHRLTAPRAGRVAEVTVAKGAQVAQGDLLVRLDPAED